MLRKSIRESAQAEALKWCAGLGALESLSLRRLQLRLLLEDRANMDELDLHDAVAELSFQLPAEWDRLWPWNVCS